MNAAAELECGRQSYETGAWRAAYDTLSLVDRHTPLEPDDLWMLALSAYLTGRDDDFLNLLERIHHSHAAAGNTIGAARCAFWIGFRLANRGEMGPASGWLGRAARLLEREDRDCVERGYLLLPTAHQHLGAGDYESCLGVAIDAADVAERFGDADLLALALYLQGRALLGQARVDEGLALLDEAMVAVAAGELSPHVTGLVYCSVIAACRTVYALRRAQEWTAALSTWCARQPDLVPHAGECHAYRAEIMQMRGAWQDAISEAARASERCSEWGEQRAAAAALHQQGDVYRLLGEFDAAEVAYSKASHGGWEPQPGRALLRLAQGKATAAAAAIQRVLSETPDRPRRARLLPAYIEIMLAVGDVDEGVRACDELEEIGTAYRSSVIETMAAHARGAILLARGDAAGSLVHLRRAVQGWQAVDVPYETARVRGLLGLACRALHDDDAAALELDAASAAFERLGAAPDAARLARLASGPARLRPDGLTPRELEVLALVATGRTNRAVGADLFISEKTVARHVSNIFSKLGLSSRSAATAYAYEQGLLQPPA